MQITRTEKEFVNFEIKNLGEHHDFYVQSNTLLLGGVRCIEELSKYVS